MENDYLISGVNIQGDPQSHDPGYGITESKEEDIINYTFEIETSKIIEAVQEKYSDFERRSLLELRNSLNEILEKERKNPIIIFRDEQPGYFDKVLTADIPAEKEKINNPNNSPFPDFFVGNTRKSGIITILQTDTEIILKADDKYFNQFFAFRVATLPPDKIQAFIQYQLKRSFNEDTRQFTKFFDFMLADFGKVIGGRVVPISKIFNDLFLINHSVDLNLAFAEVKADTRSDPFRQNAENLNKIFLKYAIADFLVIEDRLLADGFIDSDYKWQKKIIELVAFIHILSVKGYLKTRFPDKNTKNNFKEYRKYFEERYHADIADASKPSNFDVSKISTYEPVFHFIQRIKNSSSY